MQKARRKTVAQARAARSVDFTHVPSVVGSAEIRENTVSINGGPEVPMSAVGAALQIIKARSKADPAQTDLEDDALGGRNPDNEATVGGIAADRLRSLIERIERLEEERKAIGSDIKDIFLEAKSAGFSVPTIRRLIVIRRKEPADVEEQETLLDLYRRALGM